jgi:hypothetical protein
MQPVVCLVFMSPPTPDAVRVAGIIASRLGIQTNEHGVRLSVSQGAIPSGNAAVFAATKFVTAFADDSPTPTISQSVSVLHGTSLASYRIGDNIHRVGEVPLMTRVKNLLAEFPWMIILLVTIFCYLMATLLWAMVRRHSRLRLRTRI